jgi:hypothetical protein
MKRLNSGSGLHRARGDIEHAAVLSLTACRGMIQTPVGGTDFHFTKFRYTGGGGRTN